MTSASGVGNVDITFGRSHRSTPRNAVAADSGQLVTIDHRAVPTCLDISHAGSSPELLRGAPLRARLAAVSHSADPWEQVGSLAALPLGSPGASRLVVRPGDVPQLSAYAVAPTALGRRARAVLLLARGHGPSEVAVAIGTSRQTVSLWRDRYRDSGLPGLQDRPAAASGVGAAGSGGEAILTATLRTPPAPAGPVWSTRSLGEHLGVGRSTVARAWGAAGVRPHGVGTFRLATEPALLGAVGGVLGIAVAGEAHLLALATRPAGTGRRDRHVVGERFTGSGLSTVQAYAALRAALAEPAALSRRGALDLPRFLRFVGRVHSQAGHAHPRLALILDDAAMATRPEVVDWLGAQPRAAIHLAPGHAAWLRTARVGLALAEAAAVRSGAGGCAEDLTALLTSLVEGRLVLPGPFVWTERVRRPSELVTSREVRVQRSGHGARGGSHDSP